MRIISANALKSFRGGGRDHSIDAAKSILVFFVVWGHSIQYLHGTHYDFWEDPVFKFIYGFHMPLFALISGYLTRGSFAKYGAITLVRKRAKQLLIPTVGWALFLTLFDVAINILSRNSITLSWIIGRLFDRTINNLWFLKAIFIACIVVAFIEKCCKGNWIAYIICSILTVFLPSIYNLALYGFVFPFFALGFKVGIVAKAWNENQSKNLRIGFFIASLILYIVVLLFFHKDHYIYTTGLNIISNDKGVAIHLGVDIYRAIVALIGCAMILEGCSLITKDISWIRNISSKTMVIYIVTASIFSYIPTLMNKAGVKSILGSIPNITTDFVVLIPVSIMLVFFALLAEKIIKKTKLDRVLLGK